MKLNISFERLKWIDSTEEKAQNEGTNEEDNAGSQETGGRFVRYCFTPEFLKLRTVGATVEFTIGSEAVNRFRMIERHFFREQLLKTFDFDFGFCIPNSRNTCEHIYDFPKLGMDAEKNMSKLSLGHFKYRRDN